MDRESTLYLQLLRCFIREEPFQPEGMTTADWESMYQLAAIHNIQGIVGYMAKTNPCEANAPMADYSRHVMMETISIYSQRGEMAKALLSEMDAIGVDRLLFKGFVVRDLYPVPELRTFGDIDILIHREDRDSLHRRMLELGFEVKTDWEPVYTYYRGNELYEMHSHVMEVDVSDKADYVSYYDRIWEHAHPMPEGSHSWFLDPEFHLLYLLTHLAKHLSSSGAGIRMYMDIAFYLKKYRREIDWEHFQGELRILVFEDFVNVVFTAVEQWLGEKSPIPLHPVDPEIMADFLQYTLEGGVFGHQGRTSGETWLKREERNDTEKLSKGRTLLHRAFPSAETLKTRYTYLQKYPWLLPAAWIHRLAITRGKWGEHAEEAKDIIHADSGEILRWKRIYKEIGL